MGTDNLFHKRRASKPANLSRAQGNRARSEKILIVCEDSKVAPHYFRGLKQDRRLANLRINGEECGSDPLTVVRYAREQYDESRVDGDPFDRIYCVIDRDQHETFNEAMSLARDQKKIPITVIVSDPCFEYWVLLHHQYSRKPYQPQPHKSVCEQVAADIRAKVPTYHKTMPGLYASLCDKTATAIQHATRAKAEAQETGNNNPSTDMHILVQHLLDISNFI
ncbi:MAG: RloB domain-containing protein [Betaproteobacteria bacterium]|nr:RloB domain-containing protein [Betaproteobacteria bacterium]